MPRKFTLLFLFVPFLLVLSCKKSSPSSTSNPLVGNWNFLFIKANASSSGPAGPGSTYVVTANFTTVNNSGKATFTNSSMELANVTYAINTTATTSLYQGSTLISTQSTPYSQTIPPTSDTAAYQIIGTDSIYFPNGSPVPGAANGGRFAITGDTLNIKLNAVVPGPNPPGLPVNLTGSLYFLKQ
jgi:hypothetical protein